MDWSTGLYLGECPGETGEVTGFLPGDDYQAVLRGLNEKLFETATPINMMTNHFKTRLCLQWMFGPVLSLMLS